MPDIKDILGVTPLLAFFLILAWVALKLIPSALQQRKELKLAELACRSEENKARVAASESIGQLTEVLRQSRESTDELRLFMRAAMREHETIRSEQAAIAERMGAVESAVLNLLQQSARQ